MITYNHAKYVAQAIGSLAAQDTSFTYEIVVRDDNSSDNTATILSSLASEFPDKICLLKGGQNLGMIENFKTVLKECRGKFIAFCEGDDYWIDNQKLQRQVDILLSDDEVGLVYSNYSIVDENGTTIIERKYNEESMPEGHILSEIIKGEFPYTVTVCLRSSAFLNSLDSILEKEYLMGDYPLWLHVANNWKIAYYNEISCAYRRHKASVTANVLSAERKIEFYTSWNKILKDFLSVNHITDQGILEKVEILIKEKVLNNYIIGCTDRRIDLKSLWLSVKELKEKIPIKLKILRLAGQIPFIGRRGLEFYYKKRTKN